MPVLTTSDYHPPFFLKSGHLQTIYAGLFRAIPRTRYRRERLATEDEDFLDLDWAPVGSSTLVVVSHGLEGCSQSKYVRGMVRAANAKGWDAMCWNQRGCSGEVNLLPSAYHSGKTDDLAAVLQHVFSLDHYQRIFLVGYSMGGNQTLKLMGEGKWGFHSRLHGAVAISVPCNLASSAEALRKPGNYHFREYLLRSLRKKIRKKNKIFPEIILVKGLNKVADFHQYDGRYTAPFHGFSSAEDYYAQCSSRQFIGDIRVSTLIINALDDPFLGKSCYPFDPAEKNSSVFLETPRWGGHVGFVSLKRENGAYWSERRAIDFLDSL